MYTEKFTHTSQYNAKQKITLFTLLSQSRHASSYNLGIFIRYAGDKGASSFFNVCLKP